MSPPYTNSSNSPPSQYANYTQGSNFNAGTISASDLLRNGRFYLRYANAVPPVPAWSWTSDVTGPVREQGECNSCYAFATLAAMEAIHVIRNGSIGRSALSVAQMVDCSDNFQCAGGWMPRAYQYAMDVGLVTDAQYAYPAAEQDRGISQNCSLGSQSELSKIVAYEDVPTSEGALMKAVSNQPVVAAIDASTSDFMAYKGAKPFAGRCSSDPQAATHAVLVVGYNTTDPNNNYWILKNTWGAAWGDSGYFYLPMGNPALLNKCGMLNYLSYPVLDGVPPANKRLDLLASYCRTAQPFVVTQTNVTLLSLTLLYANVTVQNLLDVNLHLATYSATQFLELDEYIFIPPCSAGVPPPPVPTALCGYDYHIQLSSSGGLQASSPSPYPYPAPVSPSAQRHAAHHRRQQRRVLIAVAGITVTPTAASPSPPSANPPASNPAPATNVYTTSLAPTVSVIDPTAAGFYLQAPNAATVTTVNPNAAYVQVNSSSAITFTVNAPLAARAVVYAPAGATLTVNAGSCSSLLILAPVAVALTVNAAPGCVVELSEVPASTTLTLQPPTAILVHSDPRISPPSPPSASPSLFPPPRPPPSPSPSTPTANPPVRSPSPPSPFPSPLPLPSHAVSHCFSPSDRFCDSDNGASSPDCLLSTAGGVITRLISPSPPSPPPPPPPHPPHGGAFLYNNTAVSDAIDWTAVGAVSGAPASRSCSSSYAFAVAGAVESLAALRAGPDFTTNLITPYSTVPLSAQQLIDCDPNNQGCYGGWPDFSWGYLSTNALDRSSQYQYLAQSGTCNANATTASTQSISGFQYVPPGSESSLQEAVEGQPVVAVIHASADFLAYSGGIFNGSCSSAFMDGNYSVLVVGYSSTHWRVRTSMGPSWGEGGYMRLPMGINSCGVANWGSYPLINCECGTFRDRRATQPKGNTAQEQESLGAHTTHTCVHTWQPLTSPPPPCPPTFGHSTATQATLTFAGSIAPDAVSSAASAFGVATVCPTDTSIITSVYGTSDATIGSLGVRCGSSYSSSLVAVGAYNPTAPNTFAFLCPSGFDAVRGQYVSQQQMPVTQLAFRCYSNQRWTTSNKLSIGTADYGVNGTLVNLYCPAGLRLAALGGLYGRTILQVHAFCRKPPAYTNAASFYDISTAAGVALSHLLAANPNISATTSLSDWLADGLNRPIRVPGFCQVPAPDNVGVGTANGCSGYAYPDNNVNTVCSQFVLDNGGALTNITFVKWNRGFTTCTTNTVFGSTRYCVNVAGSGIDADYYVDRNCAVSYTVQPGDSCAAIAAGASFRLTAAHVVNLNTITLTNGTVYSKCSNIKISMLLCLQTNPAPLAPSPPPPPPPPSPPSPSPPPPSPPPPHPPPPPLLLPRHHHHPAHTRQPTPRAAPTPCPQSAEVPSEPTSALAITTHPTPSTQPSAAIATISQSPDSAATLTQPSAPVPTTAKPSTSQPEATLPIAPITISAAAKATLALTSPSPPPPSPKPPSPKPPPPRPPPSPPPPSARRPPPPSPPTSSHCPGPAAGHRSSEWAAFTNATAAKSSQNATLKAFSISSLVPSVGMAALAVPSSPLCSAYVPGSAANVGVLSNRVAVNVGPVSTPSLSDNAYPGQGTYLRILPTENATALPPYRLGCYGDYVVPLPLPLGFTNLSLVQPVPAPRAFPFANVSANMTVGVCASIAAKAGSPFFGIEQGSQCWFGTNVTNLLQIERFAAAAPSSCNVPCGGDATLQCGGSRSLHLYLLPQV
ncbi:MAG: hypothetical protein WDW38_011255 [Sanguina aurantia]